MAFTPTRWIKKLAEARARRQASRDHINRERTLIAEAQADIDQAKKVLKRHAPEPPHRHALRVAASYLGVKEQPAGSNQGPYITEWLKAVGCGAAPWCGAFMHYVLHEAGVKDLSARMRYVPWIVEDAKAGHFGLLKVVPWVDRRPGDLLIFNWDGGAVDHVGMYEGEAPGAGNVTTIEGNTAVGNDSNGGQVMRRVRNRSFISYVVRPAW